MTDLALNPGFITAPADAPATSLIFGLNFDLHGIPVSVSTDDIANAAKNGIAFALPAPVDLGTLTDFQTWFKQQFGIDLPLGTSLPSPLGDIMSKLATLDVTVEEFSIAVAGSAKPGPTLYALAMSAIWPADGGISLIPGVLSIQGAVFGATNKPVVPTTPTLA